MVTQWLNLSDIRKRVRRPIHCTPLPNHGTLGTFRYRVANP
jgi:hypothetical protein